MGKFGIFEIIIVLVALLTPVLGVIIGLVIAKNARVKSKEKWDAINAQHHKEEDHSQSL